MEVLWKRFLRFQIFIQMNFQITFKKYYILASKTWGNPEKFLVQKSGNPGKQNENWDLSKIFQVHEIWSSGAHNILDS